MVNVAFSYGLVVCEDEMRNARSRDHVYTTMRVIFACFRSATAKQQPRMSLGKFLQGRSIPFLDADTKLKYAQKPQEDQQCP